MAKRGGGGASQGNLTIVIDAQAVAKAVGPGGAVDRGLKRIGDSAKVAGANIARGLTQPLKEAAEAARKIRASGADAAIERIGAKSRIAERQLSGAARTARDFAKALREANLAAATRLSPKLSEFDLGRFQELIAQQKTAGSAAAAPSIQAAERALAAATTNAGQLERKLSGAAEQARAFKNAMVAGNLALAANLAKTEAQISRLRAAESARAALIQSESAGFQQQGVPRAFADQAAIAKVSGDLARMNEMIQRGVIAQQQLEGAFHKSAVRIDQQRQSLKGFEASLVSANAAKGRLETNLQAIIPILGAFGKETQLVAGTLRGTWVSALESTHAIFNAVFIKDMAAAAAAGRNFSQSIRSTLQNADAAVRAHSSSVKMLAKDVATAYGESVAWARLYVNALRDQLGPSEAAERASLELAIAKREVRDMVREANASLDASEQAMRDEAAAAQRAATQIIESRRNIGRAVMESLSPMVQARRAFEQTLGATKAMSGREDFGAAARAFGQAWSETAGKTEAAIRRIGSALGMNRGTIRAWINEGKQAGLTMEQLAHRMGLVERRANAMNKSMLRANQVVGRVSQFFSALFVFDRIKRVFEDILGGLIELAKGGAEFATAQRALSITAQNLGHDLNDLDKAVEVVGRGFITNKTAVAGLSTLLQSGLNLSQSTRLMMAFEESTLRMNLSVKGLNERILAASEALRDRMSRTMGVNVGLQTNFGQALRITNLALDDLNKELAAVGASTTLRGESVKFFVGLMNEYQGIMGLAVAVTNTATGQLALLDKQIQNLRVTIGVLLAPALGVFVQMINQKVIPAIQDWIELHRESIPAIALSAAAMSVFVIAVTSAVIAITSLVFAFALSPIAGFTALILGMTGALFVMSHQGKDARTTLTNLATTAGKLVGVFKTMPGPIQTVGKWTEWLNKQIFFPFYMFVIGKFTAAVLTVMALLAGATGDRAAAEKFWKQREAVLLAVAKASKDAAMEAEILTEAQHELDNALIQNNFNLGKTRALLVRVADELSGMAAAGEIIGPDGLKRIDNLNKAISLLDQKQFSLGQSFKIIEAEGEAWAEVAGKMLDAIDDFALGTGNATGLMTEFGKKAAKSAQDIAGFTQQIQTLADRLQDLLRSMADAALDLRARVSDVVLDSFLDPQSFKKKTDEFELQFEESFRSISQRIEKASIDIERLSERIPTLLTRINREIAQTQRALKSAKDDQADTLNSVLEQLQASQAQLGQIDLQFKLAPNLIADAKANIDQLRIMYEEARKQFFERAAEEHLAAIDEIERLSIKSQEAIGKMQSMATARRLQADIEAINAALEYKLLSEKEAEQLRVDLNAAANVKILEQTNKTFAKMVQAVRDLADIIVDEITAAFDIQARNQEQIDRDRAIGAARLRRLELISEIDQASQSAQVKQARILFVEQETQREIARINEESVNHLENIWNRFANSVKETILRTIVDEGVRVVVKRLAEQAGGAGDFIKKAMEKADQGEALQARLLEVNLSLMTLMDQISKLADKDSILEAAINESVEAVKENTRALRGLPTEESSNAGAPRGFKVPEPAPENIEVAAPWMTGATGTDKAAAQVANEMSKLSKVVTTLTVGLASWAVINSLLGDEAPKALRQFVTAVMIAKMAMDLFKAFGGSGGIGSLFGGSGGDATPWDPLDLARIPAPTVPQAMLVSPVSSATAGGVTGSMASAGSRINSFPPMYRDGRLNHPISIRVDARSDELRVDLERELETTVKRVMKRHTIGMGGVV